MVLKYTGTFEELKKKLIALGNNWDNSQSIKKVLRCNDGVISWFESTGTIQFQGKEREKSILEKKVSHLLYPDENPNFQQNQEFTPEIFDEAMKLSATDISSSYEMKYLESGINDSELIIGIVSAVGTDSNRIIITLKDRLQGFGYSAEEIKVSAILPSSVENTSEYERIKYYIGQGDLLRKNNNNAILAAGVVQKIKSKREQITTKKAYIVNSLKHPNEIEFLRKVYGNGFYLFGIHADIKRRHSYLTKDKSCTQEQANELIQIDEDESFDYGQKTRDTYHLSDFFLNLGKNDDQVKSSIQRFLELIFSNPYKNPTFDEFAMFMAFSSSVRSGDLSRQVGAVLTRNQQIIATGANDVPQSGGGLYWAEINESTGEIKDKDDGKDYMRQEDSNKKAQQKIIDEIMDAIKEIELNDNQKKKLQKILKDSKISDLTEFGRIVHAEMEAILSCDRAGISTIDTTLYCTTFPCHNCAKHIIAAGIRRVVYVEPYPKSRALELHSESIKLNLDLDDKTDENLVVFEPFIGVGSRRFLDLFSMNLGSGSKLRRKSKEGDTLDWSTKSGIIRTPLLNKSYIEIEDAAIQIWERKK